MEKTLLEIMTEVSPPVWRTISEMLAIKDAQIADLNTEITELKDAQLVLDAEGVV